MKVIDIVEKGVDVADPIFIRILIVLEIIVIADVGGEILEDGRIDFEVILELLLGASISSQGR
jgi:hypothetical protein